MSGLKKHLEREKRMKLILDIVYVISFIGIVISLIMLVWTFNVLWLRIGLTAFIINRISHLLND